MPRIRTIKPDFFKSEDVSPLPFRARLTWVGMWTHCDDHGRYKDNARLIKGDIWSLDDVSLRDIEDDLAVLADRGRIVRYTVDGKRYLAVVNWHAHQAINRPGKPKHPAPPVALGVADPDDLNHCAGGYCSTPGEGTITGPAPAEQYASEPRGTADPAVTTHAQLSEGSVSGHGVGDQVRPDFDRSYPQVSTHGGLTDDSRQEGKGKEGKGREGTRTRDEPPARCPRHLDDPDPPPCGGCAGARKDHERWQRDRSAHLAGLAAGPRCRQHRGQPAHNCALCRAERLGAE